MPQVLASHDPLLPLVTRLLGLGPVERGQYRPLLLLRAIK
jgi:hypothetical protein